MPDEPEEPDALRLATCMTGDWYGLGSASKDSRAPRAQDLLPYRPRRARPYLYSDEEVERLLRSALALQPPDGLRPWTFHCLFGLLSVAGLRIGEAIRLQLQDVNLQEGLLTSRGTKFGKSRLVLMALR